MSAGDVIWFEIRVRDLGRAAEFYERLFGWSFEPLRSYDPDYWTISTSGGGIRGALLLGEASGAGTRIYVESADLNETVSRATELGGTVVQPQRSIGGGAGRFVVVADLDGNEVGLWST